MSNRLIAIAKVKDNRIVYTYEYDGKMFDVETPKTIHNEGVKDGEEVVILLTVMPHDVELTEDDVVVKTPLKYKLSASARVDIDE